MSDELPTRRVEITFVGKPPALQIARASGVSEVQADGRLLRCLVSGSVQPFLEALRGYEVVDLTATPPLTKPGGPGEGVEGESPPDDRGGG